MKKILIFTLSVFFLFSSCSKDDTDSNEPGALVPLQQQFGFALNYTASWCGPCGDWGAPLIHDLEEAGNVVAITAHASNDPMYKAALYSSFDAERPVGGGIPSFYIGDFSSTNMSDMEALLAQIPKAGIAMNYTIDGLTMTINTKTEFFSTRTGIFNLVVLILEDGIDGSASSGQFEQNGVANPDSYTHDFVLRASSSNNHVYGEEIISDPSKGDAVEKQFSIALSDDWLNDVYPVVILWKKNSLETPAFQFVNAVK